MNDDGTPLEPPAVLSLEHAQTIQKNFERGFKQCAVQRAIKEANAKMEQLSAAIQKATPLWQRVERSWKVLSRVKNVSRLRDPRFRCAQHRG